MKTAILIKNRRTEQSPIGFAIFYLIDNEVSVTGAVVGWKKSMLSYAKKHKYNVIDISENLFVGSDLDKQVHKYLESNGLI